MALDSMYLFIITACVYNTVLNLGSLGRVFGWHVSRLADLYNANSARRKASI